MDPTHAASPNGGRVGAGHPVVDHAGARQDGGPSVARMARRRWPVALLAMLAGVCGAGAVLATSDRVYESSTSVLVARVDAELNLDTEAQLARSTANAADAAALLATPTPPERLAHAVTVDPLAGSSVLRIRYAAATPRAAQAGSHALAAAYLANRAGSARAGISTQVTALDKLLREARAQLRTTNERIARLSEDSPELPSLRGTQASLTRQIDGLTARVNDLATRTVDPGTIISDADLPTTPVSPDPPLLLGVGAGAGLLLGAAAAVARERFDRRVRQGFDIAHRAGVPVLAELRTPAAIRAEGVLPPHGPGGQAFNRLRNEVVASLRPGERVLLVTGVSRGMAATVVASNLAAALARADNGVVLVGANVPEIGTRTIMLSEIFDVADVPGLTDVLAHRADLARALQRAPRMPGLQVLTPGGTASAAGLLQTEGVRTVLSALRHRAGFVVVEAPSTATGPDAQSLAGIADVAIVVAEPGVARHTEVADAVEQVRRVGTRVLGAVVLPHVSVRSQDSADFRPAHRAADAPGRESETWISDEESTVTARDPAMYATTAVFGRLDDDGIDDAGSAARQRA
jgi:Mrp family chromosome partitioning ATPase